MKCTDWEEDDDKDPFCERDEARAEVARLRAINTEMESDFKTLGLHAGRLSEKIEKLEKINAELLTACQALLAYHKWAKSPGQWHNEPHDPESEVETAIKNAAGATQ